MGPTGSGEHSEFMKELQSRAEVREKSANMRVFFLIMGRSDCQ